MGGFFALNQTSPVRARATPFGLLGDDAEESSSIPGVPDFNAGSLIANRTPPATPFGDENREGGGALPPFGLGPAFQAVAGAARTAAATASPLNEEFTRSGGQVPGLVPAFATGAGVFQPERGEREQGNRMLPGRRDAFGNLTFVGESGLFSQDANGNVTLNNRETKRSIGSIFRQQLRSMGIRPRIDARATLSPRANRSLLSEPSALVERTPEREITGTGTEGGRSGFLRSAEERDEAARNRFLEGARRAQDRVDRKFRGELT